MTVCSAGRYGPPPVAGQAVSLFSILTAGDRGGGIGMEGRAKVKLFEQIRREYEFGVGSIQGWRGSSLQPEPKPMNDVILIRDFAWSLNHGRQCVRRRINWWPVLGLALVLAPWTILAWVVWR